MRVLKIGAKWCSGCFVMRPRWAELEKEMPWLKTEYFDFDEDQEKLLKMNISSNRLPSFIFLDKNDQEVERISGEIEKDKLRKIIEKHKDQ